jgi:thiamine pyrophosphate-dependent acetolactate synthase large subunit-like protein
MPMGYSRRLAWIGRNYNAALNMRSITKSAEPVTFASEIPRILRRAFTRLKSGRGGPVLIEVPNDLWNDEVDVTDYVPPRRMRTGTDPESVREAAKMLIAASGLCSTQAKACIGLRLGLSSSSSPNFLQFR